MKQLLFCLYAGWTCAAAAQDTVILHIEPRYRLEARQKALKERFEHRFPGMPNAFAPGRIQPRRSGEADSMLRRNKWIPDNATPGVYALAEDRMPCVVPDLSAVAPMPNAWTRPEVPYQPAKAIPNPMDKPHERAGGER